MGGLRLTVVDAGPFRLERSKLVPFALGMVDIPKKLGFKTDDVRYVIYSHLHIDHAGGMAGASPSPTSPRWIVSELSAHCAAEERQGTALHSPEGPLPI